MANDSYHEGVEKFVELVKLIDEKKHTNRRTYKGFIPKALRPIAEKLLSDLDDFVPASISPSYDEEDGEITIKLPSFYQLSLKEMLASDPSVRCNLPQNPIYFEDIDYIYTPMELDKLEGLKLRQEIKNYIRSVNLFSLLKTQCDHSNKDASNQETLYFLGKKKLLIQNDLTASNEEILKHIQVFKINYIESQIHKEAIKNIITDSLLSFYSENRISINDLCNNFDIIYEVIKNNYDTYISQFTFEKIKKEVEKFRTETITRINKAFSDIQMQIITIPASLIVVGANLKTGSSYSFLSNTIVLLGALFFTVAVFFMCENQDDTLENIKYEYEAQEKEFIKDPLFKEKTEIRNNFIVLNNRYNRQKRNLKLIKKSLYFSIFLMLFSYLYVMYDSTCLSLHIIFLDNFYCK
ncbi:hypothetical protein ACT44O_11475 [Acinetobacter baumannii]